MYTLKLTKYKMFISASDGCCTDSKDVAVLFGTVDEAKDYVNNWRINSTVSGKSTMQISIMEVTTRPVIQKVGQEVEVV